MSYDKSRSEKSRQSESLINENKMSCVLLATVSILSTLIGVTAAQSATEIKARDGVSVHEFNLKVAETKAIAGPGSQSTMLKTKNPKKNKVGNPSKAANAPGPDPKVLLNPQPLPPEK